MKQYLELMKKILDEGAQKSDRTGTGTLSLFGHQMRFNLAEGFPLVTTKKCHLKSIIYELLWFLNGDTNIKYLKDHGVSIWDEWADENGELGPIYGHQWRSWKSADGSVVDQISNAVRDIKNNPDSRRIIVSAWNAGEIDKMALAPCHALFQFYVVNNKLSCHVGDFVWTGGDVHLYSNHLEQAKLQLSRTPRELPVLRIKRKPSSIFEYQYEDFEIENYDPYPAIKAPVAV